MGLNHYCVSNLNMSESIRNTPIVFESKGLLKSVESLMEQYSPQDVQLLCTGIYTEILDIHTKENNLRSKKDKEDVDTSYDQKVLSTTKRYTERIIQSLGFSPEQVTQMFEDPNPEQIEAWVGEVIEREQERIASNLSKDGVLERITIAEQRLEEFFTLAGIHKQTAPIKHGGPVIQMIMKMKQIESNTLNPMYNVNQGEFYSDHGKAHVYHYDHEAFTSDYYISMHGHENVHTYGISALDEVAKSEIVNEGVPILHDFIGFSYIDTLGNNKVRRGAFIDEGATQYMNKKVLNGLVGDGEDTVFYPEEVSLYQELISLVSQRTGISTEVVEQKLAYEYATGGGLLHLKDYLYSIIPDEMETFLR